MREIKFKGKGPYGWRTGQLLKISDNYWVIISNVSKYMNGLQHPDDAVDPATVGQYTGVKDIHGTEIYEGDIVEYDILFRGKVSRTDRGKVVYSSAKFWIKGGGPLTQPSDCENLRVVKSD